MDGGTSVGLGELIHEDAVVLRRVAPPEQLAADWTATLDLMDKAATKLDEAESAEASGHPGRAEAAQNEALGSLEPRAAKKFDHMRKQMHVKFQVCRFGG